jgi:hypothetical protein
VIYTLSCPLTTTKTHPYSQTLHHGNSATSPILAASLLSWVSTTIKLAFGDPNSNARPVQWEKMHKNSLLSLNYNHYVFGVDLAGGKRRELEWKGTKGEGDETGLGKLGNLVVKRSMKLVERGTGVLLARFVSSGREEGERGRFEIFRGVSGDGVSGEEGERDEEEEEWDRVVIMSSLALQEFWRKGTPLS